MDSFPYLPGDDSEDNHPLARFLPPIPRGVGVSFLARYATSCEWVLDPFGGAPSLDVEMARDGKNVLVAVNNPITRFVLELASAPPSITDLRAALSELASTRRGEERLETHLQSLYMTECRNCQRQVPAEAFVWEKGKEVPSARIYQCPCGERGEHGEFPVTEADQALAIRMAATDSLHRARALERVAAPDDPDRPYAVQALEYYLPRAVYAIITIVNKLDGLLPGLSKERRRALLALVLAACDEASALWPHPTERPRPKQLIIPPRFLEKNVWMALERAVDRWQSDTPVHTTDWASFQEERTDPRVRGENGGVYVFDGPVRELLPALPVIQPGAVVTVLPRPNQAFWTLSALWAGWLWGRTAAAPFKQVLRRRRYDWNWHAAALSAALKNFSPHLPLNTPFFALLPEPEPAFLSVALLAASRAGFDLEGMALRSRMDAVQIAWRRRAFLREEKEPPQVDRLAIQAAIRQCLEARAEPTPYLYLHAAGLACMAGDRSLRGQEETSPTLNTLFQEVLAYPGFIHHSNSATVEAGMWGLADWDASESLPDRVEIALVRYLQMNPGTPFRDLELALNNDFPGLLTPSLGMMRAILFSYAEESGGGWTLRPEDSPTARRGDLDSAKRILTSLAGRLGYTADSDDKTGSNLSWLEDGKTAVSFFIIASAVVGKILRSSVNSPGQHVLVLPGGRAGLLAYKLERDAPLGSIAERWHVLKLRHLRRVAELTGLTRERWEKELSTDPLEPPEQLKLF